MKTSLALISGKGGCGKTTLALSLSQILARAGLKVLLVDCDMSTHGATYFFENYLTAKEDIFTTSDLLSQNAINIWCKKRILNVKDNIYFIPSCVSPQNTYLDKDEINLNLLNVGEIFEEYDVIIYDCQAGYSLVTDVVTRVTTKNLVVLEADAVTSVATRVLSSQLNNQLNSGNTYQVFNKIPEEDFSVYSKVAHGTFFTNLNPIRYDLSVRKAFAYNELPDIDVENTNFSNDLFKITEVLFPLFKDLLIKLFLDLKHIMIEHLENKLEDRIKQKKEKTQKMYLEIFPFFLVMIFSLIVLICLISDVFLISRFLLSVLLIFTSTVLTAAVANIIKDYKKYSSEIDALDIIYLDMDLYILREETRDMEYDIYR